MRTEDGLPMKSRDLKYACSDGRKFTVQLLGKGKQFIGYGTHPDTGSAYYWEGDSMLDRLGSRLPAAHA